MAYYYLWEPASQGLPLHPSGNRAAGSAQERGLSLVGVRRMESGGKEGKSFPFPLHAVLSTTAEPQQCQAANVLGLY